jgi:hypothetical protein
VSSYGLIFAFFFATLAAGAGAACDGFLCLSPAAGAAEAGLGGVLSALFILAWLLNDGLPGVCQLQVVANKHVRRIPATPAARSFITTSDPNDLSHPGSFYL